MQLKNKVVSISSATIVISEGLQALVVAAASMATLGRIKPTAWAWMDSTQVLLVHLVASITTD